MSERRLTAWLALLAFCVCGVPRVFTQTAAHALFIEAHGAAAMPWAYLAEALCVPLACALYIALTRRIRLRTLWLGTLAAHALALLLLRTAVAQQWPLAAGAAIVYFEVEFVLSSLLVWGMAHQFMSLGQGKRLFGYVSAGEPLAVMSCGLATPALLQVLQPADLLLLSAAGALCGMALVHHLLRHQVPAAEEDGPAADATPQRGPRGYVASLVLVVAAGQLAYFFVDNAFYLEAARRHPGAAELTAFLGQVSALIGLASLLSGAVLAPWLLRRFGVQGGLLALPALLLAGSAVALVAGGDALLLLVVANKVVDQSLRYTLDKSTFVTLLQPLAAGARVRVQAALEGIVEPLAGGAAALALFVLAASAAGITVAVCAVAATWTLLAWWQHRRYVAALRHALGAAGADGRAVTALEADLDAARGAAA